MNKKASKSNKYRDNLKLLFSMEEFNNRVGVIRDFLNIPQEMYDNDSDADKNLLSEKWTNEAMKKADKMIGNNEDLSLTSFNYLDRSIKDFIEDFNLPENYENSIRHHILFGGEGWLVPVLPFAIQYDPRLKDSKKVTVVFHEKLTDKDLKKLKKFVNVYFGKNLSRINPLKDIGKKIEVERVYKNRVFFDPVEYENFKLKAKDIVDDVLVETGKKIKDSEVYDIPGKLKKLREKRFSKSRKK